jgi:hypothetical protein
MGQPFHIPTEEKVRVHSGKDRRETYLEYATPREPFETRGIFQPIQIIDEVQTALPCFQPAFVHSRNEIGRSVEELESLPVRYRRCGAIRVFFTADRIDIISSTFRYELKTGVEEISARKGDLFPGRGERYLKRRIGYQPWKGV